MSDQHIKLQKSYFERRVDFFKRPIPDQIQERTRRIVQSAGLTGQSRVLDVATGVGVLVEHILSAGVPAGNITGCDLCAGMLEAARKRYPDVTFRQGDFLELPVDGEPFDTVFFNACFGNFFDQEASIYKAIQLLSPAGKIVISHPMGAAFVKALNKDEPEIVPHLLPAKAILLVWAEQFNLDLTLFCNEPALYIAILHRIAKIAH